MYIEKLLLLDENFFKIEAMNMIKFYKKCLSEYILVLILISLSSVFLKAQSYSPYFHDVLFERNMYASLYKGSSRNNIFSLGVSLQQANYISNNIGYRIGVLYSENIEPADYYFMLPIYLSVRSKEREVGILTKNRYCSDFLFGTLGYLIPTSNEFYFGVSSGYVKPQNSLNQSIINNVQYQYGFLTTRRFLFTVDVGFRFKYDIWRFYISLNPSISYLITRNFKYTSNITNDTWNGFRPTWFTKSSFGIGFKF